MTTRCRRCCHRSHSVEPCSQGPRCRRRDGTDRRREPPSTAHRTARCDGTEGSRYGEPTRPKRTSSRSAPPAPVPPAHAFRTIPSGRHPPRRTRPATHVISDTEFAGPPTEKPEPAVAGEPTGMPPDGTAAIVPDRRRRTMRQVRPRHPPDQFTGVPHSSRVSRSVCDRGMISRPALECRACAPPTPRPRPDDGGRRRPR
jgi:hypothetical protein